MESALDRVDADLEAALRTANAVLRELKQARTRAAVGQVRELRRALDSASELAAELGRAVTDARAACDVDEGELLAGGAYVSELLAAAAAAGVDVFEEDDRLLCYPSIVRVRPGDLALEIDRRRPGGCGRRWW